LLWRDKTGQSIGDALTPSWGVGCGCKTSRPMINQYRNLYEGAAPNRDINVPCFNVECLNCGDSGPVPSIKFNNMPWFSIGGNTLEAFHEAYKKFNKRTLQGRTKNATSNTEE